MKLINKKFITSDNSLINYYETENKGSILLMIHAQGANSSSFFKQVQQLSKNFHIILVDCYGHGKSSHNVEIYNLKSQGVDLQIPTDEQIIDLYWDGEYEDENGNIIRRDGDIY